MSPIWVLDTALPDDPITDRPTTTLDEQCRQATARILQRRPELLHRIDGLYFGSMGIFAGDTRGRRVPSHIPNFLRAELHLTGLRGGSFNSYASTSESGGVALLRAFRDLQQGRVHTALVVAGEQMFSADPTLRREDRRAIGAWIKGVLDPRESGPYGLSMLSIGDLLMDHLAWQSGLPADDWRDVLETVTLDKYRGAALHTHTMQGAKERARGAVAGLTRYRDEATDPWVTPWFRRDDVCASANGATALLLTTDPALLPDGGPRARILGMGEGSTSVTFAGREGPLCRFGAVRASLQQLLRGAALDVALLREPALTAAMLHDAFPSIELAFLTELAPDHGWGWVMDRFLSGWANPLGGLCGSGHALGNSGLFQAAKAAQLLLRDPRHLRLDAADPSEALTLGAGILLLTNVGSALTSVVSTLLCDDTRPDVVDALGRAHVQRGALPFAPVVDDPLFGPAAASLGAGELVVAARTRVELEEGPRWVYLGHAREGLGHAREGTRFALHDGAVDEPWPIGGVIRVRERGGRVMVVGASAARLATPAMAQNEIAAVRAQVSALRSGRLAARVAG